MKTCLILGRKPIIVDKVRDEVERQDIQLLGGTDLAAVKQAFAEQSIAAVIMGAGLDLQDRLAIIQFIFETSKATTVHMKDWDSGPTGMLPFVNGVLNSL